MYKDKNWIYNEYINNKKSMKDISLLSNISEGTIRYYLNKYNIPIRSRSEAIFYKKKNKPIHITNELRKFLIGNVLGDGGLHYLPNQSTIRTASYVHSSKYKEMLEYISIVFSNFGINQMGKINTYTHKKSGAIYHMYWTKHYEELLDFRKYLYKDGKKCIPKDLEFTPVICKHWFIGDGSLSHRKIGNPYIRLCTDGFSSKDVDFAVEKFNKLGLVATKPKSGNSIRFSAFSTQDFLNYIGPCSKEIEDIYGYKFNY